jgi:hypothetical protein
MRVKKVNGSLKEETVILSEAKDLAARSRFQILRFAQNDAPCARD